MREENEKIYRWDQEGLTLLIKAQPKSSTEGWAGVLPELGLKLKLKAPAVEGKANQALVRFVAKFFKVPKDRVEILQGERAKSKRIRITGADEQRIEDFLVTLFGTAIKDSS